MRHLLQLIFRRLVFLKQETDLCSRVFLFQNVSHSRSILTKTERKYTRVSFPKCVTLSLDFDENWKKILFRCIFTFLLYVCLYISTF